MSHEMIKKAIDEIGVGFNEFKTTNNRRIDGIATTVKEALDITKDNQKVIGELVEFKNATEEEQSRGRSPARSTGQVTGVDASEEWRDVKTGARVKLYSHKDRFSESHPNRSGVSLGRWMRGILAGRYMDDVKELSEEAKALATTPDASGGYTVPTALSAEFIDLLRNQLVLSRVGARFVTMPEKTMQLAKLQQDATAEWHAENATVNASDLSLGLVELQAKTIVGRVDFSLELSQDSVNIEAMLTRSLTAAVAQATDAAGLGSTTANGPSGIMSYGSRNRVTGVGAFTNYDPFLTGMGKLLDSNVALERIGPAVIHSRAWTALQKLKTGISGDQTSLTKPASVPPFVVSNGVVNSSGSPTGSTGYLADWADLLYGIRQDVRIAILREAFLGSNLKIAALVYARVDFAPTREQSFCTLEDIAH